MKRAYVDIPEGQVHYVTEGSGEPVLLLHHTPRSWTYYRYLIPLLAQTRRVIAMDTMGFGNSDDAPEPLPTGADYARHVLHFLDALGIKQTDICGAMTGSRTSMELAVTHPERIRRVVLWGFPMTLTQEEMEARMATVKREALLTPLPDGSHILQVYRFQMNSLAPKTAGPAAKQPSAPKVELSPRQLELLNDWVRDALRAGDHWWKTAVAVYSQDAKPILPRIMAPTLVIGLNAPLLYLSAERSKQVAALIPNGQFVQIDGDIGGVPYFQTEDLAETILNFLER